jgi:hypothetical protein
LNFRSIFAGLFVAAISADVAAGQCQPVGLFFRSTGDQLKVAPLNPDRIPSVAGFDLVTLGKVIADAPTIGHAEGEMILTRDHCVGVYGGGEDCTFIFRFGAKSVDIFQAGSCGFGVGANANGIFRRTTKPPRYLP